MLLLRGTTVTRSPHSAAKAGCEHPTHKGHCHDKGFSCGSKDLHNNLSTSTNLNPVKQKCCSHGDTQKTSTDQTRFDQTCASRPVHHHHHHEHSINSCQKKDSCRSNSKHHGHGGCNTNNTASSHVININKVETNGAKQCGHHSNHNGEHVECSKTDSSKESGVAVDNHSCGFHNSHNCSELLLGKYTNDIADSHEHSVSITCEANLLHKVSESSKKVVNNDVFNVNHSHEEEDYLGKTKHSGTTGCLHNGDGHFNCKNQASNVRKNCDDPTMNSLIGTSCSDEMVMHWCNSLEKREMDGCCKSFRKECGGNHHGCLGGGIGSLSEIITE
ncbi:hypothetical protein BVC80_7455g3 [Macleaya cordata]|uniref:Uncharacterized protein n=1 Tax=Macleaya cordata TaxID=56857 RepID=A0A200Q0P2_MACCD|nr:hypothetical protein BVC80_7455g3 [Macleaya cordata]